VLQLADTMEENFIITIGRISKQLWYSSYSLGSVFSSVVIGSIPCIHVVGIAFSTSRPMHFECQDSMYTRFRVGLTGSNNASWAFQTCIISSMDRCVLLLYWQMQLR
jgi:hypothetical protein